MERALVYVDRVEGIERLVAAAGRIAAGVEADLVLLAVISESDYEQDRQAIDEVMALESSTYDPQSAKASAEQYAVEVARDALENIEVAYEVVGVIGEATEQVLEVAEDRGCDHLFITGRRRSPSGKAIFGDTAQQLILNFSGLVTVAMRPLAEQ